MLYSQVPKSVRTQNLSWVQLSASRTIKCTWVSSTFKALFHKNSVQVLAYRIPCFDPGQSSKVRCGGALPEHKGLALALKMQFKYSSTSEPYSLVVAVVNSLCHQSILAACLMHTI